MSPIALMSQEGYHFSMPETEGERLMRKNLEAAGFSVQKIEETDERRSDYRVFNSEESHTIEVKDKENSKEYKKLFEEACEKGGAFGTAPVFPSNVIAGIIRDAADQLAKTPRRDGEFSIIWFSCLGEDAPHVLTRAQLTLYGICDVIPWAKKYPPYTQLPCFFFYFNEFFKCPHVDAAILFSGGSWALFLNSFSQRLEAFKKTKLYGCFKKVCDPIALEAEGSALIVDGPVDRKDQSAVQLFLMKKYNLEGVSPMAVLDANGIIALK